jgi:phenylacetate-coenzyme A ligase PaaK-like adenylate-forming protein
MQDPTYSHGVAGETYALRCTEAIEYALDQAPFYESWRPLDPGPGAPVDDRYAVMPFLTKRDIRAHMPKGFVPRNRDFRSGIANGEVELVSTSGTSEDRASIVWHQPWWDASEHAAATLHRGLDGVINGTQREAVLTTPLCAGTVCHIGDLSMRERTLGRLLFLNQKADPNHWTRDEKDRMLDELRIFKPELLEADPAYLAILARHAADTAATVPCPHFISLTYEFPSRAHYRQIRRLFPHTPILSSYGSTETGHVFTECECGRFHQNTEYCRVDFLPLRTEHAEPLTGRIFVSLLGNPWMAMLRFDVGDLVRLASAPCPCGRTMGLTLESVEGRIRDLTFAASGRAVTVGQLDRAVGDLDGLLAYQVEQPRHGECLFRFVAEPGLEASVATEAVPLLRKVYGSTARISVRRESAIGAEQSGKFRLARTSFKWDVEGLFQERADTP